MAHDLRRACQRLQRGARMIKLSHYVAGRLADWGVRHVFLIPGGGAMHLNDSFSREPRIRYLCNHHEQASAMAAECYARVTGRTGVVNVTTGPGGNQRAQRGVWGMDGFGAHAGDFRAGEARNVHGDDGSEAHPATGRPGSRHRAHGRRGSPNTRFWSTTRRASATIWSAPGFWRHRAARDRAGWIFRWTCRRPAIEEQNLRGYDPAEDACTWDRGTVERAVP